MKYAESILDVGRLPLRRRDRAAMVLALDVARGERGFPSDALAALRAGRTDLVRALADDADDADYPDDCWGPGKRVERRRFARLVRARLALLLRCLLRIDAGDLPWWRCPEHEHRVTFDWNTTKNREEWWCPSCRKWFVTEMYPPTRHVRPLWQDAPGGQR